MRQKLIALNEIFEIRHGNSLELNRLDLLASNAGGVPFVSRKSGENGISAFVAPIEGEELNAAGDLSCALSGNGVLSTFLQEAPFYTGFHVSCLRAKSNLNRHQLLYYCMCIAANRYRYSYGRQANRTIKDILLPPIDAIPDFAQRVKIDQFSGADRSHINVNVPALNASKWRYFSFQQLFELRKGTRLTKNDMEPGGTPYVGSTEYFNGVTAFIKQEPPHKGNTISLTYNGSVAEAFYQPKPFWATDDVNVLYPKWDMSPYQALFLCAVIRAEKYRYNYGRKWKLDRMRATHIKLPAVKGGAPDFVFMERYIKALRFSSNIV